MYYFIPYYGTITINKIVISYNLYEVIICRVINYEVKINKKMR